MTKFGFIFSKHPQRTVFSCLIGVAMVVLMTPTAAEASRLSKRVKALEIAVEALRDDLEKLEPRDPGNIADIAANAAAIAANAAAIAAMPRPSMQLTDV